MAVIASALVLAQLSPAANGSTLERRGSCDAIVDTPPRELGAVGAERAVQCLLNRRRAQVGAPSLRRNPVLTVAARTHSAFMQKHGCFDHLCPGEEPLDERLSLAGYIGDGLHSYRFGEAIAWGTGDGGTPRAIVRRLINSPPHRALLLSPRYEEVGVGFRYGTYRSRDEDGGLYTVELGRRVFGD